MELEFIWRHKRFLSEIKSASVSKWVRSGAFKNLESERDANLFLSRYSIQLGLNSLCRGCSANIKGRKYRCLDCRDMELCEDCYEERATPNDHAVSHVTAELR